mmetsp:Transcript_23531/g.45836  ORF Transcript_23531/g.45836 Transcript_23531/m.45836 type:complete len:227 (-) Transcript_23531:1210-1890(-)
MSSNKGTPGSGLKVALSSTAGYDESSVPTAAIVTRARVGTALATRRAGLRCSPPFTSKRSSSTSPLQPGTGAWHTPLPLAGALRTASNTFNPRVRGATSIQNKVLMPASNAGRAHKSSFDTCAAPSARIGAKLSRAKKPAPMASAESATTDARARPRKSAKRTRRAMLCAERQATSKQLESACLFRIGTASAPRNPAACGGRRARRGQSRARRAPCSGGKTRVQRR